MRRALLISWGLSYLLSVACFALLMQGVIRDSGFGNAAVRINPQAPSAWMAGSFRVWGGGTYGLGIESVNHDPALVGRHFAGVLAVRLRAPGGELAFEQTFFGASHDHRLPDNFSSTHLATVELKSWPLRPWRLEVRVLQGDPDFVAARTRVTLRRQDNEVGMGGLVSYAMIVPGGVFILLSLALALVLARKGSRIPLTVTGATCGLVLLGAL